MAEFLVGAKITGDSKELVAATKAGEEQLKKLGAAADAAGKKLGGDSSGGGSKGAEEVRKLSAELDKALSSADRSYRATQKVATAQDVLTRAYKAGAVGQVEYEQRSAVLAGRLDQVEQRAAAQALTWENLAKGHVRWGTVLRSTGPLLAGLVGGLVSGAAATLILEGAELAASAAMKLLTGETGAAADAHKKLAAAVKEAEAELNKISVTADMAAANAKAVAAARIAELETLSRKEIEAIKSQLKLNELFGGDALGMLKTDPGKLPMTKRLEEYRQEIAALQGLINQYDDPLLRIATGKNIPKDEQPKTGSNPVGDLLKGLREDSAKASATLKGDAGQVGAAYAELEVKLKSLKAGKKETNEANRLFWDTYQTKGQIALKAYGAETEKQRAILDAEIAGKKELIPLIELEFQLREQYGAKFVGQNRERITALAAERAAMERLKVQWQGTQQFLETGAQATGDIIKATLVLSWDRSADAVKNWENTTLRALQSISDKLIELAVVNPLLNSLFGGTRGTAYGAGGLLSEFGNWLGGMFGGSYQSTYASSYAIPEAAPRFHEGGLVGAAVGGAAGQMKYLPAGTFARAPRAHRGLGPDEMPIVAKRGEGIFTPRQMDNADSILGLLLQLVAQGGAGGGDVKIEIVNQSGTPLRAESARQGRGPGGERILRVFVVEAVKGAISSGDFDAPLGQRYGSKVQAG